MFATVRFGGVANHFVPITIIEVHIDVGHGFSSRIQESFKEQVVLDWIKISDLQAISNRTPRCRSTTRSNPYTVVSSVSDEIPSNKEVGREIHVGDDPKFVSQTVNDFV